MLGQYLTLLGEIRGGFLEEGFFLFEPHRQAEMRKWGSQGEWQGVDMAPSGP